MSILQAVEEAVLGASGGEGSDVDGLADMLEAELDAGDDSDGESIQQQPSSPQSAAKPPYSLQHAPAINEEHPLSKPLSDAVQPVGQSHDSPCLAHKETAGADMQSGPPQQGIRNPLGGQIAAAAAGLPRPMDFNPGAAASMPSGGLHQGSLKAAQTAAKGSGAAILRETDQSQQLARQEVEGNGPGGKAQEQLPEWKDWETEKRTRKRKGQKLYQVCCSSTLS